MTEEETEEKPNPLVRQRDLDVMMANNRAEHWKTRVALIGLTLAANSPILPKIAGYLGVNWGGVWPW